MTDLTPLLPLAREIVERCSAANLMVATAESCTGGLVAGTLTEIAGSSVVVDRGFVTYSNAAKNEVLGVPADLIDRLGAVSEEVARAMVTGALDHSRADLAVSITGIAGPGGGSADKPVGLVHFASGRRGMPAGHFTHVYAGLDRSGVRLASVDQALRMLRDLI
ncbi:CinA family protein [Bauldia litoralis]|uniref:Nicotinamide-nucleotide amidase n=1 Tax=Bauldia litoralis TaxID=665467 RepID=A0A1G6AZD9_9HYPH|nr:CinA family protein [Bauldia litoralis]SDB13649.1 nicotinamide-nucleotide amidase [Bauldia litoralis]